MKFKILTSFAISCSLVGFTNAQEITVLTPGGAYTASQVEAYYKPFTALTGIKINSSVAPNAAEPLKSQVDSGNISIDVADIARATSVRYCDEGLLERFDASELPAAPDGTLPHDDFIEGGIGDCGVANILWSKVIAFNTESFDTEPVTIGDFFDLTSFPGKRGMRKTAKATLEMALLGDDVPADKVYDLLRTEEGLQQAFAKLDSIKDYIIWWEAGAQPPQLLADKEVVMTTAYNGRIFNAAIGDGQPFKIIWDGQILDFLHFVIPRGTSNLDAAKEFIKFATSTERLAAQATWISYAPARQSSIKLVGKYKDGKTDMAPHMPTAPKHMENALISDYEFWVDYESNLEERFVTWLNK